MIDSGEQRPRRRWIGWMLALVVAAGAGAGAAVWQSRSTTQAALAPAGTASAAVATALPRPPAGAPVSARQAWVAQEVKTVLAEQTAGLLAGDLARFSTAALPSVTGELGRRFRSLRALQVTRFEQKIDGQPFLEKDGRWRVAQLVDHCLVDRDCALDQAVYSSLWRETADGLRLDGFRKVVTEGPCTGCGLDSQAQIAGEQVRPWQTTDLAVQVGARTLVAAPKRLAGRLPELTRRAEAAAALADRYAVGDGKVLRYRIFVADDAAWKLWYDGAPGSWVAGRVVPTAREQLDVEVLATEVTDELLRHELAHVSTLRTMAFYGQEDVWWLVEGMAEYVQQNGAPASAYPARPLVRDFLSRRTLRSVVVTPPGGKSAATEAAARYGVGYYALNHLITKYGKPAALTFFQQAVRFGIGLDGASIGAFGKPWSEVDRDCAAAVRRI